MQSRTDAWRAKIANFPSQRVSVTLATTNPDGAPRAADVYFVSDADLNLYFYSEPASRHTRNIDRDSRVAATARVECITPRWIRWLDNSVRSGCKEDFALERG